MNKKRIIFILVFFIIITSIGVIIFLHDQEKKIEEKLSSFYLIGKTELNLSYNESYEEKGFDAIIDEKDYKEQVQVSSNLDTSKVGTYTISYTITYKNKYKKTLTRQINVKDEKNPEIKIDCNKDIYKTIDETFDPLSCKPEAHDEYDGNLTSKIEIDNTYNPKVKGDYKITYKVKDSSGNEVEEFITVHVQNKFEHTYIKVDISKQHLYYYKYNEVVLDTPVTTGAHNATKTGSFKIRNKVRDTSLRGKNYVSYVKYWMAYDGNSYGLHDASWRNKFGTMDYYYNGSHGCVNLPTQAAEKLFNSVEIGTPVYISK